MVKNYTVVALNQNADGSVNVSLATADGSSTCTIILPAGDPLIGVLTIGRPTPGTFT